MHSAVCGERVHGILLMKAFVHKIAIQNKTW